MDEAIRLFPQIQRLGYKIVSFDLDEKWFWMDS